MGFVGGAEDSEQEEAAEVKESGVKGLLHEDEVFYRLLSHWVGDKKSWSYAQREEGESLSDLSSELAVSLFFSQASLLWDNVHRVWRSQEGWVLSHMGDMAIESEIKVYCMLGAQSNASRVDVLLYVSPRVWYYVGYHDKNLTFYSGLSTVNAEFRDIMGTREAVRGIFSHSLAKPLRVGDFVKEYEERYGEDGGSLELRFPSR